MEIDPVSILAVLSDNVDGNKISQTTATHSTTAYTYNDDNQLAQTTDNVSGTTTYTYDANGSQTKTVTVPISGSATTNTYTYDLRNRMVGFTGGGNTASYVYDDAGNRVEQTTNGTNKYFVIDANNPSGYPKPIEIKSSPSAAPLITYLIGDQVIGQVNSGGTARYLAIDGVGATRALITSAGSVVITFSDDAFKNAVNYNPAAAGTFWMQDDAMFDGISGLSFHGSGRQSNNVTGRWMTADDQQYVMNANPLSGNLYLLDGANPGNATDPTGHEEVAELITVSGIGGTLTGFAVPATVGAITNVASDFVLKELEGQTYSLGDLAFDTVEGAALGAAGEGLGQLAKILTKALGPSLTIRVVTTGGKWLVEAAVNTLAQVVEYRYKTSSPPSWPPADLVGRLLTSNLLFGALFHGIGAASDQLVASAENEIGAIRQRFKMSGGDPEQASQFFNDWAAGRVTNSDLKERLDNLEKFLPALKTIFGDGPAMSLINEFSKAFVYALSGDLIKDQS